jgi:hypothetical protein
VIRKVFCNKFDRSTVSHKKKRVTNKSMPRDRAFLPYLSDCYPPFVFPSLSSPSKLESEGETTMVSSSLSPLSQFSSTNFTVCEKPTYRPKKIQIGCGVKPTGSSGSSSSSHLRYHAAEFFTGLSLWLLQLLFFSRQIQVSGKPKN